MAPRNKEIFYDPAAFPVDGMFSSPTAARLKSGQFQLLQNLRWSSGALDVRGGIVTIANAAPNATYILRGAWSGELNGTVYHISAWDDLTKTRIYSLNIGTGAWTELTGTNQWYGPAGNNRLSTHGSDVIFIPVRAPRSDHNLVTRRPQDVLLIGNGEDDWRIYLPLEAVATGVSVHKPVTVPLNALSTFRQLATFYSYFQCSAASGKTYAPAAVGPPPVNSGFKLSDSTLIYTGGESVPQLDCPTTINSVTYTVTAATFASPSVITTSAPHNLVVGDRVNISGALGNTAINGTWYVATVPGANTFTISATNGGTGIAGNAAWASGGTVRPHNHIAPVQFAASMAIKGDQLHICVEGIDYAAIMAACALDINRSAAAYGAIGVAWANVYDPNGDQTINSYQVRALDTGGNRFQIIIPCQHLSVSNGDRTPFHVRFRWVAASPSKAMSIKILAIGSAGDFRSGTQFAISYEDQHGRSESYGIEASRNDVDQLSAVGGPASLRGVLLASAPECFYDYVFQLKNSDGASSIAGGLDGEPNVINFYFRLPGQTTAYYATNTTIYNSASPAGVNGWTKSSSSGVITVRASALLMTPAGFRDPSRELPSAYQISIPIASAGLAANQRLFVGSVKDTASGSTYSRGDGYFSQARQPFRFQAILEDEIRGSRFTFDGERIQAFVSSSSVQAGAMSVYMLTNAAIYELGGAHGFMAQSTFSSTAIQAVRRIASKGTNSPLSVREFQGFVYWVDQESQATAMGPGHPPHSISYLSVDDKLAAVPGARRGQIVGAIFKDRYRIAYTATGSTNTRMLIWNHLLNRWESDDLLPAPVTAERLVRIYDSSAIGSGQRLLVYSSNGRVYACEEGTTDLGAAIAIRIMTRKLASDGQTALVIGDVRIKCDPVAATSATIDRHYEPASTYRTTMSIADGWNTDTGNARTEVLAPADGIGERGQAAYLDLTMSLPGASRLAHIGADILATTSIEAKHG